ncbi:DNA (cytosine-5-)-methyltransferase [Enterococcus casseliflavus]|nr:DNA (cytosine-5-)-methyltransferase [Enterococcus casseliflavus]
MAVKKSLTFLDLFAGVGGFRLGMERAGHRCVGFCEIDKFARKSYKAIHETTKEVEMHDITQVSDEFIKGIGRIDVVVGGFPCQAFSIAGKRRGFEDTRGTLFFEIARFASLLKPRYLFLENVRGLLSHDNGNTFETILETLDDIGYDVEWEVLNSKNYVPQNRERIFIIGHLRTECTNKIFPIRREKTTTDSQPTKINLAGTTNPHNDLSRFTRERTYFTNGLMGTLTATDYKSPKQIVVGNTNPSNRGMSGKVYASNGIGPTLTTNGGSGSQIILSNQPDEQPGSIQSAESEEIAKAETKNQIKDEIIVEGKLPGSYRSSNEVLSIDGISSALTTMQGGGQEKKILIHEATKKGYAEAKVGDSINLSYPNSNYRRGRVGKGIAHTILTGGQQGTLTEDFQIRKLTPLECWRLQAFPDWAFLAAKFNSKDVATKIIESGLNHYDCEYEQQMSDSQLYKQAGNSVTVSVIYEIAKRF